jgi:ATP-dependent Clp protease adaptor protein ClpS
MIEAAQTSGGTQTDLAEDLAVETSNGFILIVHNDEVNTFDWVIQTLIEICQHSYEQAEQCAWFIHTKGKYGVKHGQFEDLHPMKDAITERGIQSTIECL